MAGGTIFVGETALTWKSLFSRPQKAKNSWNGEGPFSLNSENISQKRTKRTKALNVSRQTDGTDRVSVCFLKVCSFPLFAFCEFHTPFSSVSICVHLWFRFPHRRCKPRFPTGGSSGRRRRELNLLFLGNLSDKLAHDFAQALGNLARVLQKQCQLFRIKLQIVGMNENVPKTL